MVGLRHILAFMLWPMLMIGGLASAQQEAPPATQPIAPAPAPAPAATPAFNDKAVVVIVKGAISNFTRNTLFQAVENARAQGADNVILKMTTPGGPVQTALEITSFIKRQRDLNVVAYVQGEAYSAGTMIAIACDRIVMEPNSAIGDCAPIAISDAGQLEMIGAAERAKVESPILADFYDSAARNGYDPDLTAAFVAVGRSVHWIENKSGGQRDFVDTETYAERTKPDAGWTPVPGMPDPIDRNDTLLTVHTDLALKLGLAASEASSFDEFVRSRGFDVVATYNPPIGEKIVDLLSHPIARFLLLVVFMQSLYAALHAPGHGFPEAIALSSLALLIGIPMMTGTAQWWEIGMILLGLVLLAIEIFVIPGFGITGITGILLMIVGLVMVFVPREPRTPGVLPSLDATWQAIQQGLIVVTGGLLCSIFLWFWLNRFLPKLPYFNRLILTTPAGSSSSSPSSSSQGGVALPATEAPPPAAFPLAEMTGRAVTDLRPGGCAEFFDQAIGDRRLVDVVSDSGFVRAGTAVVIRQIEGSRIVVRTVT